MDKIKIIPTDIVEEHIRDANTRLRKLQQDLRNLKERLGETDDDVLLSIIITAKTEEIKRLKQSYAKIRKAIDTMD